MATTATNVKAAKPQKRRRKPAAFLRRYGRVLFGGTLVAFLVIIAIFAPYIAPFDPLEYNIEAMKQYPSEVHWFGTDALGRDLFSRVVYGARITLIVGIMVQIVTIIVGSICGLLCGYYRRVDAFLSRFMEGLAAMPGLLLTLVMCSVMGPGIIQVVISMVIGRLPGLTRMMRAQVLSLKEKEFVESAKAMGSPDMRTIFLHILPHTASYLIIRFTTGISGCMMGLAGLAFLGVGLDPAIPNWGSIINAGLEFMYSHTYMIVYPGIALAITIFGFNMMGEGLRDILDPRYK